MVDHENSFELEALDNIPKYALIAAELRAAIASGALGPNERLPSYAIMTHQYQVAKHTVERAYAILQQEGLVRREERRGVFVEPKRRSKTGNIGLLLHGVTQHDTLVRGMIEGLQKEARPHGLNIMLFDRDEPLAFAKIDGLLIYSHHLEVLSLDLPPNLPRVLLLEPAGPVSVANAIADNYEGTRLATLHLLELGHRRISLMYRSDVCSYSWQRLAGYRAALREYGLDFDSRLCKYINGPEHPGERSVDTMQEWFNAEDTMKRWFDEGWRSLNSTAILAHNDIGALALIKTLSGFGLAVPQDVSVVGFDGIMPPRQNRLTLTTVEVPFPEVGARGMELLWRQIREERPDTQRYVVPVQLKVGQSTQALPAERFHL